jgi:hypothetical protein
MIEAQQTFYFPLERRPLSALLRSGQLAHQTLDFKRPSELRYQLTHDPDARTDRGGGGARRWRRGQPHALEEALIAETFWSVTGAIATALGNQRTERALDALIGALDQVTSHARDASLSRRLAISAPGSGA